MYLVTGGAGFIGSHIVDALVRQGVRVKVMDNFYAGKRENLKDVIHKIKLIKGDIRNFRTVKKAMGGVRYVFHQAALRSVPKSLDNPSEFNEVNVAGTLNLLLAARESKVKRFVFASSSSVYGDITKLPEKESFVPQPISPYAVTKWMGEVYCRLFTKLYGLPTISLRYFNVFGPRQSLENKYAVVVPKFITCLLKNQPPPIHGDGKQSRDFTYVDNVVKANLLALKHSSKSVGQVFNIACGQAYTVLELVRRLNQLIGKKIKPVFTPPRPGDVQHTRADVSRAKRYLGFARYVDFEEGLRRTIDWFSNQS